jgi:pimeloyl-ACP methyl ester carboxylesterase
VPLPSWLHTDAVTAVKHVFYLHGFASGAASTKARWLAERLAPFGVELLCPDFNLPDFSTLTVTRMIADVERWMAPLAEGPVALIGSSLGALVAYHAAVAQPFRAAKPIDRLILLAPALDIAPSLRRGLGGARVTQWQRDGALDVYHFGYGEQRRVNYTLFEDAERYDPFTTPLPLPMLIFQGTRDDAVDPDMVKRFASERSNVELHLLDDGHQLIASLPYIWDRTVTFLGLKQ